MLTLTLLKSGCDMEPYLFKVAFVAYLQAILKLSSL